MAAGPPDEQRLQRFIEGRLGADEQRAVQAQLARSPETRRTLDALREEDRLLREALASLSEPPRPIGEKVLAILHAEQRRRSAVLVARRWRRGLLAAISAAAVLLLAFYALGPQKAAGRMVSGTGAAVVRLGAPPVQLGQDGRLYEGDVLLAGAGEFVRLRLAEGSLADVDEDSRLEIAKGGSAPLLGLESGRAYFQVAPQSHGLRVRTALGYVRGAAGACFEVWLAGPVPAWPPDWAGAYSPKQTRAAGQAQVACVTVLEGTAYVREPSSAQEVPVSFLARSVLGPGRSAADIMLFEDRQALDSRREPWHGLQGRAPPALGLLGLLPPFDWVDLGANMGLTEAVVGASVQEAVKAALQVLAQAEATAEPALRAERFGKGQQDLRLATQGLPLASDLRWPGRVLEGLAHYERGRALLAVGTSEAKSQAHSAFLAATLAFHEALTGGGADRPLLVARGLAARDKPPEVSAEMALRLLLRDEQALLLAQFYEPWALCQLRLLAPAAGTQEKLPAPVADQDSVALFEATGRVLEHSVEGLAARHGQARALALAGRPQDALALLQELMAASVAGLRADLRPYVEGIRQAAHLDAARLYAQLGDPRKLRAAVQAFQLRYPLDGDGPVGRALEQLLASAGKASPKQPAQAPPPNIRP